MRWSSLLPQAIGSMLVTRVAWPHVDRANAAEALLAGRAGVDTMDEKGRTALSHAARYGSLDCISVLAQYHANVFHQVCCCDGCRCHVYLHLQELQCQCFQVLSNSNTPPPHYLLGFKGVEMGLCRTMTVGCPWTLPRTAAGQKLLRSCAGAPLFVLRHPA